MTLVTLVGLITIGLSTYMITYSHVLYRRFERVLAVFERSRPSARDATLSDRRFDVIVYGLGRYGSRVVHQLADAGSSVLAVDFDPHVAAQQRDPRVPLVYGDAEEPEVPSALPSPARHGSSARFQPCRRTSR